MTHTNVKCKACKGKGIVKILVTVKKLSGIMERYELNAAKIAKLLKMGPSSVFSWLSPKSIQYGKIKDEHFKTLKKLGYK